LEGPAAGALAISCSTWANSAFNLLNFAAVDSRRRSSSVSESDERVCVRIGGRRYDCSTCQLGYIVEMLTYLVFERISAEPCCGLVGRSHPGLLRLSCFLLLVLRSGCQLLCSGRVSWLTGIKSPSGSSIVSKISGAVSYSSASLCSWERLRELTISGRPWYLLLIIVSIV
jgi:hypothetical protein